MIRFIWIFLSLWFAQAAIGFMMGIGADQNGSCEHLILEPRMGCEFGVSLERVSSRELAGERK